MAVAGVPPVTISDVGEIVQVVAAGTPPHDNATVPLNPPLPPIDSEYVAAFPAATVDVPPDPADTAKSGVPGVTNNVSSRLRVKPPPVPTTLM
jgi:hypothetical protein